MTRAERALALSEQDPGHALREANAVLIGSPDPPTESIARRALGLALRELGDLELAEYHLVSAITVAERNGLPTRAAQARLSLVPVRAERGDLASALGLADAAEPHLGDADRDLLLIHRGVVLTRRGELEWALTAFDQAVKGLAGQPTLHALALANRAIAHAHRGDGERAERDLNRAGDVAGPAGNPHVTAASVTTAARQGKVAAALGGYEKAERALAGRPGRLAALRVDLAEALLAAHLPEEARLTLTGAVHGLAATGSLATLSEARLLLAQTELLVGDAARALRTAERARTELLGQHRYGWALVAEQAGVAARFALGELTPAFLADARRCSTALTAWGWPRAAAHTRLTAARVALGLNDHVTARAELVPVLAYRERGFILDAARWHATALCRLMDGDRPGALAALRAGLRSVADHAATAGALEFRAHAALWGDDLADLGLALALDGGRARTVLSWSERRRSTGAPGRRAGDGQQLPGIDRLRCALGDAALVSLSRLGDELCAVVVTARRCVLRRLGSHAATAETAARLTFALRRMTHCDQDARALDHCLLDALENDIGRRPLVVVPVPALAAMPWGMLPRLRGRPVCVVPSAARWLTARTAGSHNTGVVVVAGPGLELADREVAAVARSHPDARLLTGPSARIDAVLSALDGARMAHLAAHGAFGEESPMSSGLRLADGRLMAYDLLRLNRPPHMVVLSACEAGMAKAPVEGAPLGFADTLLSLGSACVIASPVPVRDADALSLMTLLHELIGTGQTPASALAAAGMRTGVTGFVCFGAGHSGPVATGRDGSAIQFDQEPT